MPSPKKPYSFINFGHNNQVILKSPLGATYDTMMFLKSLQAKRVLLTSIERSEIPFTLVLKVNSCHPNYLFYKNHYLTDL